jgi:hypothetical protein
MIGMSTSQNKNEYQQCGEHFECNMNWDPLLYNQILTPIERALKFLQCSNIWTNFCVQIQTTKMMFVLLSRAFYAMRKWTNPEKRNLICYFGKRKHFLGVIDGVLGEIELVKPAIVAAYR